MTAMPLVKPVTTGYGMNLIAPPKRARPMAISRTPAMSVQIVRPSTPYFCDDAVDDDDEGARRPADLDAAAAEKRDQEPGDDRGDEALLRGHARGDREGDRERDRDDADDDAGLEVGEELRGV